MQVTVSKTAEPKWLGNGFGTRGAIWAISVDGVVRCNVSRHPSGGVKVAWADPEAAKAWVAHGREYRYRINSVADAKREIRAFLLEVTA
jgi:hypothetical protein